MSNPKDDRVPPGLVAIAKLIRKKVVRGNTFVMPSKETMNEIVLLLDLLVLEPGQKVPDLYETKE